MCKCATSPLCEAGNDKGIYLHTLVICVMYIGVLCHRANSKCARVELSGLARGNTKFGKIQS